jgi:hypothetical protein
MRHGAADSTTRARRPTMTADLWLELVVVIVRIIAAGLAR